MLVFRSSEKFEKALNSQSHTVQYEGINKHQTNYKQRILVNFSISKNSMARSVPVRSNAYRIMCPK